MTWPIQDLADIFLVQLATAPNLKVFDGAVNQDAAVGGPFADLRPPYALVYFLIETPDGQVAPDAVSLTLDSTVIDAIAYVHCVGASPQAARAARAVAGKVQAALLDQRLAVPGRDCSPIRRDSGNPPERDETTGAVIFAQVDVYRFRSVPA